MKFIYVTLVIISIHLLAAGRLFAQKPVIDASIYGKWPGVEPAYLSNDGGYFYYKIDDTTAHRLTIKGTHNAWKKELTDVKDRISFANEGQLLITKHGQDSLCVQTLGSDQQEFIPRVSSFIVSQCGNAVWLIYQLNSPGKELVLRNLATGKSKSFSAVINYQLSAGDQALVLQQQVSDSVSSLTWLDLGKGVLNLIWQGKSAEGFQFSSGGKGMAFTGNSDMPGKKAVWYYKTGDERARILTVENSAGELTQGLLLGSLIGFNSTGDKLFFTLQPIKSSTIPDPNLASVDIYSYKDAKLQSRQLKELQGNTVYTYVFDLSGHKLIALEQKNEHLMANFNNLQKQKRDFVLIGKVGGGDVSNEWNWNPGALISIYLVSTVDGTRKCLCKDQPAPVSRSYQLSPDEKYVVYYNAVLHNYYSYTIASGITHNISKGARADWIDEDEKDWPDSLYEVFPGYRWAVNDKAVFISSRNDIYQADPLGQLSVIRLTDNYGRTCHFQFSIAQLDGSAEKEIDLHSPLLLKVLNEETRDEGFCKVMPGQENKPELLKMVPYHMDLLRKARDSEVYTVQLESAENSPNQFLTRDFKTFTPLTDNHPEKAYNWMTSQLVNFRALDGKATQGILFKPENFNPKKKYPVIFEYYERNIVGLHGFDYPGGYTDGSRLEIASYVSNGYLLFTPDIYYAVGHPGGSAYNTIISAAHYLAQFTWVDKEHFGLMGHSFGGFETNYVITHTHLFAAAVSMSGMTDFVSAYGSIIGGGASRQRQYELYRDRIGATLWQRPDLYLENSPVLKANEVTTPVLLMANKKDDDVPYEQGVEFFTALRRLGKKAWMLQYDNGGHQVTDPTDQKDLSIRMMQFFNFYLKGEPPPKWMVEGIPATEKGIDNGYELMPWGEP